MFTGSNSSATLVLKFIPILSFVQTEDTTKFNLSFPLVCNIQNVLRIRNPGGGGGAYLNGQIHENV